MSAEEQVKLREGEGADLLAALEEENAERAEEVFGSFLVKTRCRGAGCTAVAYAVPEKATVARCIECGRADQEISWPWFTAVGEWHSSPDTLVRWREECVCGFSMAEHESDKAWAAHVPHLAAEVTSTDVWPVDVLVPSAVVKLRQRAAQAGWMVRLTYSRGYAVKQYWGEWQLEERIAVRIARTEPVAYSAVAVYRTIAGRAAWAWQSVWMWGPTLLHFGRASLTELDEWLAAHGERDAAWYVDIAQRKDAAATESKSRAKKAAAARPKKSKGSEEAS